MINTYVKQWRSQDQTKLDQFIVKGPECNSHVETFIAFYEKKYYRYMRKKKVLKEKER